MTSGDSNFAELFASAERITDLKSAAGVATVLKDLADTCTEADKRFVEENYSGNAIEAKAVEIARGAASEAAAASAGKLILAIASEGAPEACNVAHAENAITLVMSFAFSKALDATWDFTRNLNARLMSTDAAGDADHLRSQLGILGPYAADRALASIVTKMQDSAIELHNELMTELI
ncbi:MAG: hypothetical protein ACRDQA_26500 [Nocardioidaceae bacterium]